MERENEREIIDRIEKKKKFLSSQKILYSDLTDSLSLSLQLSHRMTKALKNQTTEITKKTKRYVNLCVERALLEAEQEYTRELLEIVSDNTKYVRDLLPLFLSLFLSLSSFYILFESLILFLE